MTTLTPLDHAKYILEFGIGTWRRTRAKGRCAAGGQGSLGCAERAVTVVRNNPFALGACAAHERGLAQILVWLVESEDPPGHVSTDAIREFAHRVIALAPPGFVDPASL
jgi:hypothetical protein